MEPDLAVAAAVTGCAPAPAAAGGGSAAASGTAGAVAPAHPRDETARQRTLDALAILDTAPEQVYDDLVHLAAHVCDAPIALISLVDRARQWFKASRGLDCTETSRDISFCGHALLASDALFVVEDALADPRFSGNPMVVGEPHIRFYAGATIRMPGGEALGTICVIDTVPRRLDLRQRSSLEALARQVSALLQLRQRNASVERHSDVMRRLTDAARGERRRSVDRLDLVLRGGQLGFWEVDLASGRFSADRRGRELIGTDEATLDRLTDWRSLMHPEDFDRIHEAMQPHRRGETDHCICEHRLRHAAGHWVWVLACSVITERDAAGKPLRIAGTHMDISSRIRNREMLRRATDLLERTGAMAKVGGWEYEIAEGRITWTDEVYALHELPKGVEPELAEVIESYPMPDRLLLIGAMDRAVQFGESYDIELPFITAKGRERYVRAMGEAIRVDGVTVRLSGTVQDISDRRLAEQAAFDSRRRLQLITDQMPATIAYIDATERYTFLNEHSRNFFGPKWRAALGRTAREVRGEAIYAIAAPHIAAALRGERAEFSYSESVGEQQRHLRATYIPDTDRDGKARGFYAMAVDVTELHETQRRLETLARVDALTGLPNRREFDEQIVEALRRARRQRRSLAVMFLDVDHFKDVNDTLGHAGGDAVLCEFGRRLRAQIRETDTIARVAGDEFIVICEAAGDRGEVEHLAAKLVDCIGRPFELPDGPRRVTTSIGVAMGDGGDEASALLARADAALYEAKRAGRGRYAVFGDR